MPYDADEASLIRVTRRDYERALGEWLEERRQWSEIHGPAVDDTWTKAKIEDWREITAGMNGDRPATYRAAVKHLHDNHLLEPSKTTVKRWLKVAGE